MMDAQETAAKEPDPKAWPPVWKIWANPILRRYCRSRLRLRGLSVWMLITLLISGFIFFVSRESGVHRFDQDMVDAERNALFPLLFLQGIILFMLGTGQVAGAMTAEADEGVLDYQRLAPMSPLAKVFGYLFGLPIREYVLFALTMPFSIWALWRGEVPLGTALQLYGVFLTAGVLYHLTGLVAGTVVKNRRWAFLISMAVVFLLYTVIPQLERVGLVYFKYLTIMPVVEESYPHMVHRDLGAAVAAAQNMLPSAKFFNLDFPQVVFTLLSQGVLILTMMVMLWRRWRRNESHLLGKAWATGLFGWVQLVLLGNALPLIEPGYLFPSKGIDRFARQFRPSWDWEPEPWEAVVMAGVFGMVTLVMLWILTIMITPSPERRLRGWRRARKLGQRRLSPFGDPSSSFPWIMVMVVLGGLGWFTFTEALYGSRWYPGQEVPELGRWAFLLVMATGGLGFHALLEGKGSRSAGLAVIVLGFVPIMVGTVVAVISERFAAPATWLIGLSPGAAPIYAATSVLPPFDLPQDLVRAIPRAFWFWQSVGALGTVRLIIGLRQSLKKVARQAAEEE